MGVEKKNATIQRLNPEQLDALVAAQNEIFADYIIPTKSTKQFFIEFLKSVGGSLTDVQVALDGTRIVGYVNPVIDGREGWIGGIGVVPDCRSKGVGTQLLNSAEAECRMRGVESIFLEVIDGNDRAKKLYESLGYVTVRKFVTAEGKPARFEGFGQSPKVASFSDVLYLHERAYSNACWQRRKRAAIVQSAKGAELYKMEGGFVVIRTVDTNGFIPFLGVIPEARGRGVGTGLAKFALTRLWDAGAYKVALFNLNEDQATMRLLDKFDFKVTMKQTEMMKSLVPRRAYALH